MGQVLSVNALALVKDRGYSLRVIDREFHVVPQEGLDSAVLEAINQLKEHLIDSLYLMDEINDWARDDHKKWGVLLAGITRVDLDIAPKNYEVTWEITPLHVDQVTWELTPGGLLLAWVGNRYNYARGIQNNNEADISFFGRVVHGLEERVPEALAADKKMADMFRKKVRRPVYGADQKE